VLIVDPHGDYYWLLVDEKLLTVTFEKGLVECVVKIVQGGV
jgi:hypothetical protein